MPPKRVSRRADARRLGVPAVLVPRRSPSLQACAPSARTFFMTTAPGSSWPSLRPQFTSPSGRDVRAAECAPECRLVGPPAQRKPCASERVKVAACPVIHSRAACSEAKKCTKWQKLRTTSTSKGRSGARKDSTVSGGLNSLGPSAPTVSEICSPVMGQRDESAPRLRSARAETRCPTRTRR